MLPSAPSMWICPRFGCSWKYPEEFSVGRPRPRPARLGRRPRQARGRACSGRRTPSPTSLPRSEQVADGVPGTDEHLRLMAPQHGGFAGRDLDVPVYFHWFRMVIWGWEQEQTRGSPARGEVSARQLGFANSCCVRVITSGDRGCCRSVNMLPSTVRAGRGTAGLQSGLPKTACSHAVFHSIVLFPTRTTADLLLPLSACDAYSTLDRGYSS